MTSPNNPTEGVYGAYTGVTSGATPTDDSDLHNTSNPHAQASPPVDLSTPSTYPLSSPTGYYAPIGPSSAAGNPHHVIPEARAGDNEVSAGMAGNLDALYSDLLRSRQPADERRGPGSRSAPGFPDEPTIADIYLDESYGKTGEGRS